jgi:hypothetical protein
VVYRRTADNAPESAPAPAWRDVLPALLASRLAILAIATLSTMVVRKGRYWGHPFVNGYWFT